MKAALAPRAVVGEGAVTAAAVIINAATAFGITWLVGRGLGPAGAGYFFVLTSCFVIVSSAIGMGADTGLMRSLSRQRALGEHGDYIPTIKVALVPILAVGGVLTMLAMLAAPAFAAMLGLPAHLTGTLRVVLALALPGAALGVLLGACRGLGRVHVYSILQNLTAPLLRLAAVAAVLWVAPGVTAVVLGWTIPVALVSVAAAFALRATVRARLAHTNGPSAPSMTTRSRARGFWAFSLPRGAAVLVERGIDWADVMLVFYLLGPAASGVYGVVSRCAMVGQFLESALRIVAGPRISAALALEDTGRTERIFTLATRAVMVALWPVYLVLAIFAEEVLRLFGASFASGAGALRLVCLAMMLATTAGMLQTFLLMGGRSHWQLMNRLVHLATLVSLTWFLAPRWGLLGAAVAWTCGIALDTILAATQVHRSMHVRAHLGRLARTAALPLGVVGTGALLIHGLLAAHGWAWTLPALAVLGLVYALALHRLRTWAGLSTKGRAHA